MKTTKEMIAVMEAYERGQEIEVRYMTDCDIDANWYSCKNPNWNWRNWDYRVKPKPALKPVDLSILIDSGIDCCAEYWEGTDLFASDSGNTVEGMICLKVRPRMNYWFSMENFHVYKVTQLINDLRGDGFEVECKDKAFRITGLQPDRCWPWECDE